MAKAFEKMPLSVVNVQNQYRSVIHSYGKELTLIDVGIEGQTVRLSVMHSRSFNRHIDIHLCIHSNIISCTSNTSTTLGYSPASINIPRQVRSSTSLQQCLHSIAMCATAMPFPIWPAHPQEAISQYILCNIN